MLYASSPKILMKRNEKLISKEPTSTSPNQVIPKYLLNQALNDYYFHYLFSDLDISEDLSSLITKEYRKSKNLKTLLYKNLETYCLVNKIKGRIEDIVSDSDKGLFIRKSKGISREELPEDIKKDIFESTVVIESYHNNFEL